jgi:glutaconate CoA-transferase subunit B
MGEEYAKDYTLMELIAVAAAREIRNGEIVFGGLACQYTNAPNCVIVFEARAVDCKLAHLPTSVGEGTLGR